MSQDFKIGDRIQTIVSPLNDEFGKIEETPIGAQGTILNIIKDQDKNIHSVLILFDEPMSHRHTEATDFGVSYEKAYRKSWWVTIKMLQVTTPLTDKEKQTRKEQDIIKKCKFLDKRFKEYQRFKKSTKSSFSFSKYIKGNY